MLFILGFIVSLFLSFLIVTLLIYLICICFGLTFSWPIAIGIWLVLLLLKHVFGK